MIGFYPEQSVAFTLPVHNCRPVSKRMKFYARFLTARQRIQLQALMKAAIEAEQADDTATMLDKLDAAIAMLIVRVENAPTDFNVEKASHHLSSEDLWTTYAGASEAIGFTRDDLKKSASPSNSSSKSTANTAAPADGSADAPAATIVAQDPADLLRKAMTAPPAPPAPPSPPTSDGREADATSDSDAGTNPAPKNPH